MAQEQLGIRLTLDGASAVTGGLGQIAAKLGDLDTASAKVGDAFKTLGMATLAAVGIGSVAAIKNMVTGFIDAAEGLKDLGIKTGATVESLSAFARIGKLTGTTADTIGQAMNRLAKNMAGSTEESKGAAQALKALGLDFNTFSAMRPEDKMVALARALNQFEDGSSKSAAAMALMGKSGAELLPFMRDLGNAGELVAGVTTEQAEAADLFNDSMTIAAQRTEDMKRALALGLLPALITLHDLSQTVGNLVRQYLAGGAATAAGEFDAMGLSIRFVGTVLEALIVLSSDVAFVFKSMGNEIGGIVAQFNALGEGGGVFTAEGRAAWTRVAEMMRSDQQQAREELDRFQAAVLGATDRILQQRDALKNHSLSSAENRNEMERLGARYGMTGQKTLEFKGATDQSKQSIDQAAKAGQDYLVQLDEQLASLNTQISLGRELTKAEEARIKLEEEVRVGKKKLTDQELEAARAKLLEVDALRAQVEQLKASEKATLAAAAAREKELQALMQSNDKLQEEIVAQQAANMTALTGVDYTGKLTIAKLRDAAATADRNALIAMERQENEALAEQFRQQAIGLRALADEKEKGVHIKAAQDAGAEWKKTTDAINNGLTDALMRAFESGRGFMDAFKQTLVNAFKTMVLEPTIRAVIAPVGGALGSLFSGSAFAGQGAGGMGEGVGSLLSMGMNFLSGKSLMSGASGGVIRLGDWLSTSSNDTLAGMGNFISGNSGVIGSGLGMLGNAFAGYGISKALSGGYSAGSWVNTVAGIASAIPGIGPIAGVVGGLVNRAFGMKAKELRDAGIQGSFTAGGASAQKFQDWFQKGGWFRSNKSGTDLSALGGETADALNAGAFGVLSSAKAWAETLKLPAQLLSSVTTQFKVKLTGNAQEDQAEISRLFERYADDLAASYQAQLAPFQKAGETLSATFQRLAGLQMFSEAINEFGGVFSRIAGLSVDAKEQLIAFAGGIDALLGKTRAFVGSYYSEAEQAGLAARAVREQLGALGIESDLSSRADFRALVEATDVSNEAGRQRLAQLLDIAAAFAPVGQYLEAQGGTLSSLAGMAPATSVLQDLLSGQATTQEATVEGLSELADVTAAAGNAQVGTLERLIERVGQLETALVNALDRNARTISDAVVIESAGA